MNLKHRELLVRLLMLFIGLVFCGLGVSIFLNTNMGSDPFNVLIQGVQRVIIRTGLFDPTHGTVYLILSILIIIILFLVDRSYVRPGTLVCMFCGGAVIDFFSSLVQPLGISEAGIVMKLIAMVIGCVILAFGVTMLVCSEAGTGPNDLISVVISEKTGWKFGLVRFAMDVIFVVTGFLCGGKVGIGTLICAFLVNPVAEFFMPVAKRIVSACLKKAGVEK